MLKVAIRTAVGAALVFAAQGSMATTWTDVTVECPIGGEKFKARSMASNSYIGQRPDGRPYSPMSVSPYHECPGNGFVMFKEAFSKDEIARLTPLVASAEYQALRESETQYYRAWWLMDRTGAPLPDRIFNLMVAGWETDQDAVRKARYQSAFVSAVASLERDPANPTDWFWLNLRAANALRELGRFDEANRALDGLDQPSLLPTDEDQRAGARQLIDGLRALNGDRNPIAEPANLIPPRMAVIRCKESGLSPAEVAACSGDEVKAEIAEQAKWEAQAEDAAAMASEAAADAAAAASEAAELNEEEYAAAQTARTKKAAAAAAAAASEAAEAAVAAEKAVKEAKRSKSPRTRPKD